MGEMQDIASAEGMVTRKECARLLKVTERTVRNLQADGHLTPYHVAGDEKTVYYQEDEVEELRQARLGKGVGKDDMIDEAAMNMAMAPSSIIRAFAEAMKVAQDHAKSLLAPVTDAMKMNMETLMKENRSLRDRGAQLEAEIFDFIELQKKALRDDHEARLIEITELESQKMKREAFDRFMGYAPLLATLVGEKLGKSPSAKGVVRESALVDIIDKMSYEQLEALQKSGAFGQAEMATVITMKERLEAERAARLQREAEALETEEEILEGDKKKPASEKPASEDDED